MQQELYRGHYGSYLECAASWSNDDGVYSIYTQPSVLSCQGDKQTEPGFQKGRKWKVILKPLLLFI